MKKTILHACCAPCASYPIQKLLCDNIRPVVFFYNPNIYPYSEYLIRQNELKNYCSKINIDYIEGTREEEKFLKAIEGYENEPEKGLRCERCFLLRLDTTAQIALKLNIKSFTTTLSVSPHKNSKQIFKAGQIIAEKYNLEFLNYDFKKQDGFKKSREIAKDNSFYLQTYCGCKYSIRI